MDPGHLKDIFQQLGNRHALVIGDIMLDHYLWGDVERVSPEAPVPVVQVERDSWHAGGAANVALNLRALGSRVTLIGNAGNDEAGDKLRELLHRESIDTSLCPALAPTILKSRVIARHQQLCRLDREDPPSSYRVDPEMVLGALQELSDDPPSLIILSDYGKGFLSSALVKALQEDDLASESFLAMDPKPRSGLSHKGLDLITPNRSEALQLANIHPEKGQKISWEEVIANLHQHFQTREIVITMGAEGMLMASTEGLHRIPTFAQEVFDVSGAGDTVIAAIASVRSLGWDLETASRVGNLAAGVVVGKLGTATATPGEIISYNTRLS